MLDGVGSVARRRPTLLDDGVLEVWSLLNGNALLTYHGDIFVVLYRWPIVEGWWRGMREVARALQ